MIVVCDINEVWRKKPFAALAEKKDVLGVSPADWFVARRRGKLPATEGTLHLLPVTLPPSWASRLSGIGQRMLWKKIVRKCNAMNQPIDAVIVTSPHYLPMLSMIPRGLKTIYYASDDYRSYEGWGHIADLEKEMVMRVDHAFFVSQGLLDRARDEYKIDPAKLSVSMNATEGRFCTPANSFPVDPPSERFMRPIAGVVGGINDRLDFDLLQQCADLPGLGTLLLVGPIPEKPSDSLRRLLKHPKCKAVGRQPHDSIHLWFQCLDVGLIPYVSNEFNRMCSPMRLFDHLGSGSPIVTTTACDQVNHFSEHVSICENSEAFVDGLDHALDLSRQTTKGICWPDRAEAMLKIMEDIHRA